MAPVPVDLAWRRFRRRYASLLDLAAVAAEGHWRRTRAQGVPADLVRAHRQSVPLPSVVPFELVHHLREIIERRGVLPPTDRALVEDAARGIASLDVPVTALDQIASFFGAWRQEKRVYRLTPALAAALRDVPWPGDYPCAHFRLPSTAVAIEVPPDPARGEPARTLTAHLDLSVLESPTAATRLAVHVHELEASANTLRLRPLALLELGAGTLRDAVNVVRRAELETRETMGAPDLAEMPARERAVLESLHAWDETSPAARLAVNTLLYILGEPDVVRATAGAGVPAVPAVRHGVGRAPAGARRATDHADPDVHHVGTRYAAAIRRHATTAESGAGETAAGATADSGRTVRPHLRSAHWHLYWTGVGRRIPTLRFIPTTVINAETPPDDEAPAPVLRLVG